MDRGRWVSEDGGGTRGSAPEVEGETEAHWFTRRNVDVLVYKVNRRPLGGQALLFEAPEDALAHFQDALSGFSGPIVTGRRFQREWRVGNRQTRRVSGGAVTGILGWSRQGEALTNVYDSQAEAWRDLIVRSDEAGVAPFAYVRPSGYLGVLRHPSFSEQTIATVLTSILNEGEVANGLPTVDWAVEPVGDEAEFLAWLDQADLVTELRFVFRLPNPDAEAQFEELEARRQRLGAERIAEQITAPRSSDGLSKAGIRTDRLTQAFLAAALTGLGFVVGKGYRRGRETRYDQRNHAARERVEGLAVDWEEATDVVIMGVLGAARKRGRDGSA